MKRLACLALLIFAGTLGTAQAQVATTDLVPAAPVLIHPSATGMNGANITPDNPAAVAWGNPSRVAAGYFKGSDEITTPPTSKQDFKGNFLGIRLVGNTLGFAAEQTKVEDNSPANLGTLDQSSDAQLSFNLGNSLALGIGAGNYKSNPASVDSKRLEGGASLRLNDVWYLGLALYQDKNTPPGSPISFTRHGTLAGIALRTEGSWHWYLAYDYIKLGDFNGPGSGGATQDRFTVQLSAGSLLLGGSSDSVKQTGASVPTVKVTTADIGWAPMKGLTVTARMLKTDASGGGAPNEQVKTNALNVAWLF